MSKMQARIGGKLEVLSASMEVLAISQVNNIVIDPVRETLAMNHQSIAPGIRKQFGQTVRDVTIIIKNIGAILRFCVCHTDG